jgi:hypothetical protein
MARPVNRGILPIVAVAGLILAGCGGGSAQVAAAPPATTTRPAVAPNTPAQRAADKAHARRAVLKLTDFPLGWTSSPHDNSGNDSDTPAERAAEKNVESCSHLPKRFFDDTSDNQPAVDSPDFSKGQVGAGPAAEIQSNVEIDRSVSAISEPLSYLARPRTAQCFGPFFKAVFRQSVGKTPGVTLTDFKFGALSVGSLGDQSAGYQGRVTIAGPRASIPVEFDLYFVRVGRGIATLTATAFSIPFDQAFAQDLLQKMVSRLNPV